MSPWRQTVDKLPVNSLLVSTPDHTVIRFYCPIRATCVSAVSGYKIGERVFIDGVYHDKNNALLYMIDGLKLPHHHFHINN